MSSSSDKLSVKKSLKNSGLVGGAQIINIILGVVKTKAVALLLGPSGVGLIELFTSALTLLQNVFSFGLGFSGVRDISESFGSGDKKKLSRTANILDRWLWFSGLLGVVFMIAFSKNISTLTFGNLNYWQDISFLSIAIIFSNLAASKSALIRGVRNMSDFVRTTILASLVSTIVAVPVYYFFRERGIVPVLISTYFFSFIINYIYSKKISLLKISISLRNTSLEGFGMVKFGVSMVIANLVTQLTLYYIRIYIGDELGLDYIGYYTVATTLTVTYMGLIFNAMGADYLPKLSAINKDDKKVNIAVLEQTKIILLLGVPFILAMFTFSHYIIITLYSKKFILAQTLLILMLVGVFLRLIGFPIGYVFMAKGKSKIFIFTQTQWNVFFISFTLLFWEFFDGLTAVGLASVISYIIGVVINIIILKKLTNFKYDKETKNYIILFSFLIVFYLILSYYFKGIFVLVVKLVVLILVSIYCFKMLEKLVGINILLKIKSIISKTKK